MARETGDCFSFYFCLSFERSFVGVIGWSNMGASQHTSEHQQNSMRDMSPKRIPCCLHTCCPICHGPLVFLAEQQPRCETRSSSIHVSLSPRLPALLFSRSLNAPNRGSRVRRRRWRHGTLDRGTYVFFSYAAAVAAVAPEHERFVGVVRFTAAVVLKWLFTKTTNIRRLEKLG